MPYYWGLSLDSCLDRFVSGTIRQILNELQKVMGKQMPIRRLELNLDQFACLRFEIRIQRDADRFGSQAV